MRKAKIKTSVLGEEYIFYVWNTIGSMECTFRIAGESEERKGIISETFGHLIFEKPITLLGYYNGVYEKAPKKTLTKIKIPKHEKHGIRDYIQLK